ncbi:MAG: tyrosine--tRNA ligase [Armatimonadetes bacterium]|nr:tyrosine--tRNA ligase [Armatimonadota bacterium]
MPTIEEQLAIIRRGVAEIVPDEELIEKLTTAQKANRPLRVKLGLDPTAPDIHLGWSVVLRKLRQFQDLGHQACLIIGDFTAQIGDPSGKSKTRKQLTREEVEKNAKDYEKQLFKILDPAKTTFHFNGDWLGTMTFADVIRLGSKYTVARMLEREDFARRFREEKPISIHEFLYPLCQGYDSVAIQADIEMGGMDQKFNNLVGRDLQREFGQEPQVTLMMPLLLGLDGVEKMSQSLGNYIGIMEPANSMYGKIMSMPDEMMRQYFELCTDVPLEEIDQILSGHPKAAKQRLATEIVTLYHDSSAAAAAAAEFERVFASHELPEEMESIALSPSDLTGGQLGIIDLLRRSGFAPSNNEARRLIEQGGVSLDGERVGDVSAQIDIVDGSVLKVGKRKFGRITLTG